MIRRALPFLVVAAALAVLAIAALCATPVASARSGQLKMNDPNRATPPYDDGRLDKYSKTVGRTNGEDVAVVAHGAPFDASFDRNQRNERQIVQLFDDHLASATRCYRHGYDPPIDGASTAGAERESAG